MDDDERMAAAAQLITNMDQAQATFGGMGKAFATMYREMVDGGLPRHLAGKIILDVAHEFAAATVGKRST